MLDIRLDIALSISRLSSFASNSNAIHIQAIKRILRYLKGSINKGINYNKINNPYIQGYCDVNYGGEINIYKSTSEYVFIIGNGLISWKSKL